MLPSGFVWVGSVLILFGAWTYIRDIYRGTAKPNLVTWFLWALAPLIAFFAQLSSGNTETAIITLAVGLGPALVVVAGLKRGYVKLSKFDLICGSASLVALVLWILTNNAQLAIALSILADALAATPTIIKSFRRPNTESPQFFLLFLASATIALLTIRSWTPENYAFTLYIFVLYAVLFSLVRFRIGPRLRRQYKNNRLEPDKLQ